MSERGGLSGAAYLVPFGLSLALNGAALVAVSGTLDRARQDIDVRAASRMSRQDSLQFEFVEAPPKAYPRAPRRTRKVSDRDALNQDRTGHPEARPESRPQVPEGPSDQLAQKRGEGSTSAQASAPSIAAPQAQPVQRQDATQASAQAAVVVPAEDGFHPVEPKKQESSAEDAVELKESPASQAAPQSPAQSAHKGDPGLDKIIQREMSRRPSTGASLYGVTSFEATGSGMGEYMRNLKEKIWGAWFPYIAFRYPQDFRGADAVLSMTIDRAGRVRIVKIVQSQGSPVFAQFCTEAVQRAGDFGPLPEEILALLGKEELEIHFAFHYR